MNIWNTVFLVLVLLLAAVGVFFVGQEMKIQADWRSAIANLEKKIPESEQKEKDLKTGSAPTKKTEEKSPTEMSLDELNAKLRLMVSERKKAWFGCQPVNVNAEGVALSAQQLGGDKPATPTDKLAPLILVEAKLMITEPKNDDGEVLQPDGFEGLTYLFDEGLEGGGSFLGRFMVKQVEKTQVGYQATLVSANELSESEVDQIKKSIRSTWAVYLVAPMDRHDGIFDHVTSDELEMLIPNKDSRRLFENPDRPLRDFDALLTAAFQRRVQLQVDIDSTNRDIASLNASLATSNQGQDSLRSDIELAKKQVAEMETQRKAVADKLDELDAMIDDIKEKTEYEQKRNEWFVSKIAEYQLKVAQMIEQKTEEAVAE